MGSARALVDRLWDAMESGNLAAIHDIMTPSTEVVMPGGMRLQGSDRIVPFLQMYRTAFPDLRHQTVNHVESGNTIAVELHITGTHTGPMRGPTGEIPATGKIVVWDSVDFITVSENKIATWHAYFDQLSFLTQLGLMPAPATA